MPRRVHTGCLYAAIALATVAFLPASAAADAGVNITGVEGASLTKRVADMTADCTYTTNSATINWGDGTTSAGTFETGSPPGLKGTHTYVEEGTFNGKVTWSTSCTQNEMVTFTATVSDPALTASGVDISPFSGQPFTGVVSHFTDADPGGSASDYTATIKWGDGTASSTGTVSAAAGGGFNVTGTHTYASNGQSAVNVTIKDHPATAQSSSTATITPPVYAKFSYSPSLPCRDQDVTFDASASGGEPISSYEWSWLTWGAETDGATPKYKLAGGFPVSGVSPFDPPSTGLVHGLRPPQDVTLTVHFTNGQTATTTKTISFANPDELGQPTWDIIGGFGYYLYAFTSTAKGKCEGYPFRAVGPAVAQGLSLGPATLGGGTLTTPVSCDSSSACKGTLVAALGGVHLAAANGHRRIRKPTPLGHVRISVAAGGKKTVHIHLNKRGRQAARKHELKRVLLALVRPKTHVLQWTKVRVHKRKKKH